MTAARLHARTLSTSSSLVPDDSILITYIWPQRQLFTVREIISPKSKRSMACSCKHDEATPSFRHQSLQDATSQVRLLHLHPAKTLEAPLCATLLHQDLAASAGQYEALSYTWSGDLRPEPLLIANKSLQIRGNLQDALRRIRLGSRTRVLWIDAVCIDQTNDDEKTIQVKRMGTIYREAAQTIIWVGEDSDRRDGRVFFELVQDMAKLKARRPSLVLLKWLIFQMQYYLPANRRARELDKSWDRVRRFCNILTREKSMGEFLTWDKLENLFLGRRWFSRRCKFAFSHRKCVRSLKPCVPSLEGVIQESLLSKVAVMKCGQWEMDRQLMVDLGFKSGGHHRHDWNMIFQGHHRSKNDLVSGVVSNVPSTSAHAERHVDLLGLDLTASWKKLLRHLEYFDQSECGDSRDRLAALLGLHPQVKHMFNVDYGLGTDENYIRFAKAIMSHGGCCHLLQAAIAHHPSPLPSWVPDWRQRKLGMGLETSFADLFARDDEASIEPRFMITADGRQLAILPFVKVGIVVSVARRTWGRRSKDAYEEFQTNCGLQSGSTQFVLDHDGYVLDASGGKLISLFCAGDVVCFLGEHRSLIAEAWTEMQGQSPFMVLRKTFRTVAEGPDAGIETFRFVWAGADVTKDKVSAGTLFSEKRSCAWLALE